MTVRRSRRSRRRAWSSRRRGSPKTCAPCAWRAGASAPRMAAPAARAAGGPAHHGLLPPADRARPARLRAALRLRAGGGRQFGRYRQRPDPGARRRGDGRGECHSGDHAPRAFPPADRWTIRRRSAATSASGCTRTPSRTSWRAMPRSSRPASASRSKDCRWRTCRHASAAPS